MSWNGRNEANISFNSQRPFHTTDPLNGSGTVVGVSVSDSSNSGDGSEERRIQELIEANPKLKALCGRYEIQHAIAKYLPQLNGFEIDVVCDDSGSMNIRSEPRKPTRWEELCKIVKTIVEIGVIFNTDGVGMHFLNRKPILNVTNPAIIDQEFQTNPHGYTPLSSILEKIFRSKLADPNPAKKFLVFVATDGEPTDDKGCPNVPELERVMTQVRQVETTHVSFLVCSDDEDGVAYLSDWDKRMIHVDTTDDYITERNKIRRYRRRPDYPFSQGDYIVKAMMGSVVPELDRLNEPE